LSWQLGTQLRANAKESPAELFGLFDQDTRSYVAMPQRMFASITDGHRISLCQVLDNLLDRVGRASSAVSGFEQTRQLLEVLPLSSAEFSLAVHRLANAQRYLQSGERGAARYELGLLRRSLES
jgi:hypothetical protein